MYSKDTVHMIVPLHEDTIQKLQVFVDTLLKWQKAVNLISKHSIHHIWHRHIADSMQLYPLIAKEYTNIGDLGSGGGLPAIVLAILTQDKIVGRDMHITMIESDKKKSLFLKNCVRELDLNASVINDRIENIQDINFDIITSRALCDVTLLLDFLTHLKCPHGLFLKGETVDQEIKHARKTHVFSVDRTPSLTHDKATIISVCL